MTGQSLNGRPRLHIQQDLMLHFEKSPGRLIFIEELCRVVGATELQVQKSIGGLRRKPIWRDHLEVAARGRAWRYNERPGQATGFSAPHPNASAERYGYAPDETGRADPPPASHFRKLPSEAAAELGRAGSGLAAWRPVGRNASGCTVLECDGMLYIATPL